MSKSADEPKTWSQDQPEAELALEALRRSLAHMRSQVETFKEVVRPEGRQGEGDPAADPA